MALPAAVQAVQDDPVVTLFYAVAIDLPATALLPAKSLRLLDGSAVLHFLGQTWVGADGDYGSIGGCENIEEAVGVEAPKFALTVLPLTDAAMQQFGAPKAQGAPATFYEGYLNRATGQPIADPEPIWFGMLDIGHIDLDTNSRTMALDIMCAAELMMLTDDGSKLSSSWHNQFFPGQLGFQFVDTVTHFVPWGAKGPRPDQALGGSNYDVDRGGGATTLKF